MYFISTFLALHLRDICFIITITCIISYTNVYYEPTHKRQIPFNFAHKSFHYPFICLIFVFVLSDTFLRLCNKLLEISANYCTHYASVESTHTHKQHPQAHTHTQMSYRILMPIHYTSASSTLLGPGM